MRSFDSRVASRTNDDNERLYFLEQFTTGTPRELVHSCMMMPPRLGHVEARRKLDERYGDTFRVAQVLLEAIGEMASYFKRRHQEAWWAYNIPHWLSKHNDVNRKHQGAWLPHKFATYSK